MINKQATTKEQPGWLRSALAHVQVLLANGDQRRKSALQVTNQEFPELRNRAVAAIIVLAAQATAAETTLRTCGYVNTGVRMEYERQLRHMLEAVNMTVTQEVERRP